MPAQPLIADLAESLMATCVAVLGADVPARQSIAWTDSAVPVGACDEIIVNVPRLWRSNSLVGRGQAVPPGPRAQPSIPVANLRVRMTLACWPTVDASGHDPTAAAVTAAAVDALTKVGTLWLGVCEAANDGTLFDDVAALGNGCLRTQVLEWTPTGAPAGAMVSGSFDCAVSILHEP